MNTELLTHDHNKTNTHIIAEITAHDLIYSKRMIMVSEQQLINLVKYYLILEFKERGIEAMCVKEFLPLFAALLYPYKDADIQKENNNSDSIIPIVESIRKHTKKVNDLKNYNIEGLRLYFKNNWLPFLPFEHQFRFLKCISLIDK